MAEKINIVVAEDSQADAELLIRELRRAGFDPEWRRVDTEADFEAAIKGECDLVLSDYEMPQFGGLRALEIFRQSGLDLNVPFILVSGTMGEERAVAAVKLGADDYLLKDRLARLGAAVRQSMETKRLRRRQAESLRALGIFRALIDRSKDIFEVVDPQTGRFLDVSQSGCDELGYTREELLRLRLFDVEETVQSENWAATVADLRARGGSFIADGWHHRKDGSRFPVEASVAWVHLDRDYVIGIVRNATNRRQAEEALRQSDERFRQMAQAVDEVFWMTDPDKKEMLYVSPAYERIWGRSVDELQRKPAAWIEAVVPEDRERVAAAIARQAAGTYDEEYRIARPDGTQRWIHDRAFVVMDDRQQVRRIVGVAQDVTTRKKLEEQFLHAQRMEAIGTLAAGVAHDLNNILTPMLMAAGLLRENLHGRDQNILTLVEQGAQRGAGIVRQLLTFGRGIAGARVSVQIRHLIKEMDNIMQETFPKNLSLHRHSPNDLWTVRGDATQLHQVLMNLCVNARDAMPAGGVLSIEALNRMLTEQDVRSEAHAKAGPYVQITVRDTGVGIPPEIIKRIFDPFFTTKGIGKGTGLGLSTVTGIVHNHEGFIRVYSEAGRGAAFHVYLPAEPAAVAVEAPPEDAPEVRGRGELVLVVDDEASIREAARYALEGHGYRVVTANNGEQAVARFIEQRDDVRLVLTDIMMPMMDGPSLVRSLRVLNRNLKVIGSSGLEHADRQAEFAALGMAHLLVKPYDTGMLLEAVRRQLQPDRDG